jgi:hypothetical protein
MLRNLQDFRVMHNSLVMEGQWKEEQKKSRENQGTGMCKSH